MKSALSAKYSVLLKALGLLLGVVFFVKYVQFWILSPGPRLDLDILLNAARRFSHGEPVYLLSDVAEHTKPPLLTPLLLALSRVPESLIRSMMDVVIGALPFVVWWQWNRLSPRQSMLPFWSLGVAFAVLSPVWHAEARLGQYNLLLIVMTLAAAWCSRTEKASISGILMALGILLKPTQLIFLPWVIASAGASSWKKHFRGFAYGALSVPLVLGSWYMALAGADRLIADHLQWLKFLPQSTLKHIDRLDNYGIPALLSHQGAAWAASPITALAATLLSVVVSVFWKRPDQSFQVVAWISLALSPMTWKQNFIVLLPLTLVLASRLPQVRALFGLASILLIGFMTPYWTGEAFIHLWGYWLGPSWCALLGVASSVTASRKEISSLAGAKAFS